MTAPPGLPLDWHTWEAPTTAAGPPWRTHLPPEPSTVADFWIQSILPEPWTKADYLAGRMGSSGNPHPNRRPQQAPVSALSLLLK